MFLNSADSAKEAWKTIITVPDKTDYRSFHLLIIKKATYLSPSYHKKANGFIGHGKVSALKFRGCL